MDIIIPCFLNDVILVIDVIRVIIVCSSRDLRVGGDNDACWTPKN